MGIHIGLNLPQFDSDKYEPAKMRRLVEELEHLMLALRADEAGGSISTKLWSFDSPTGSTGVFYFGGFYEFHSAAFTPAGGTNVGTANNPYGAHALVILGASSTNMVVRVTGTSITDGGVRQASDTEDIDTSGGSSGDYFETTKHWIGQVSYKLQSGSGVTINAGFSKYWDFGNSDFTVIGLEATWEGGAADSGADIELIHHDSTGWAYGGGGTPTLTTNIIASMATDCGTESNVANNIQGAWKRNNLSVDVMGENNHEGILWRITTTANKAFELGNLEVTIFQTEGAAEQAFK